MRVPEVPHAHKLHLDVVLDLADCRGDVELLHNTPGALLSIKSSSPRSLCRGEVDTNLLSSAWCLPTSSDLCIVGRR